MFVFISILVASAFLFCKEKSIGSFLFATYIVSTISGLAASLIEPLAVLFVFAVFGHVFWKRHPDAYHQTKVWVKKGRKRIRSTSPQVHAYVDNVYNRGTEFLSFNVTQMVLTTTTTYMSTLCTSLKIKDIAEFIYGLLYTTEEEVFPKKKAYNAHYEDSDSDEGFSGKR